MDFRRSTPMSLCIELAPQSFSLHLLYVCVCVHCGSPSGETDWFIWAAFCYQLRWRRTTACEHFPNSPPVYQLSSICLGLNHLQIAVILGNAWLGEAACVSALWAFQSASRNIWDLCEEDSGCVSCLFKERVCS